MALVMTVGVLASERKTKHGAGGHACAVSIAAALAFLHNLAKEEDAGKRRRPTDARAGPSQKRRSFVGISYRQPTDIFYDFTTGHVSNYWLIRRRWQLHLCDQTTRLACLASCKPDAGEPPLQKYQRG